MRAMTIVLAGLALATSSCSRVVAPTPLAGPPPADGAPCWIELEARPVAGEARARRAATEDDAGQVPALSGGLLTRSGDEFRLVLRLEPAAGGHRAFGENSGWTLALAIDVTGDLLMPANPFAAPYEFHARPLGASALRCYRWNAGDDSDPVVGDGALHVGERLLSFTLPARAMGSGGALGLELTLYAIGAEGGRSPAAVYVAALDAGQHGGYR